MYSELLFTCVPHQALPGTQTEDGDLDGDADLELISNTGCFGTKESLWCSQFNHCRPNGSLSRGQLQTDKLINSFRVSRREQKKGSLSHFTPFNTKSKDHSARMVQQPRVIQPRARQRRAVFQAPWASHKDSTDE